MADDDDDQHTRGAGLPLRKPGRGGWKWFNYEAPHRCEAKQPASQPRGEHDARVHELLVHGLIIATRDLILVSSCQLYHNHQISLYSYFPNG